MRVAPLTAVNELPPRSVWQLRHLNALKRAIGTFGFFGLVEAIRIMRGDG
jgi:hypothetical protein